MRYMTPFEDMPLTPSGPAHEMGVSEKRAYVWYMGFSRHWNLAYVWSSGHRADSDIFVGVNQ